MGKLEHIRKSIKDESSCKYTGKKAATVGTRAAAIGGVVGGAIIGVCLLGMMWRKMKYKGAQQQQPPQQQQQRPVAANHLQHQLAPVAQPQVPPVTVVGVAQPQVYGAPPVYTK